MARAVLSRRRAHSARGRIRLGWGGRRRRGGGGPGARRRLDVLGDRASRRPGSRPLGRLVAGPDTGRPRARSPRPPALPRRRAAVHPGREGADPPRRARRGGRSARQGARARRRRRARGPRDDGGPGLSSAAETLSGPASPRGRGGVRGACPGCREARDRPPLLRRELFSWLPVFSVRRPPRGDLTIGGHAMRDLVMASLILRWVPASTLAVRLAVT